MAKNSRETQFLHLRNGPTDRRTDRRTDGRTDGRTDRPSYRDAFLRTHLKRIKNKRFCTVIKKRSDFFSFALFLWFSSVVCGVGHLSLLIRSHTIYFCGVMKIISFLWLNFFYVAFVRVYQPNQQKIRRILWPSHEKKSHGSLPISFYIYNLNS